MGGWSDSESENENRFVLKCSDFVPTNISNEEVYETKPLDQPFAVIPTDAKPATNFFYSHTGFTVGNYFDGPKKIYTKGK